MQAPRFSSRQMEIIILLPAQPTSGSLGPDKDEDKPPAGGQVPEKKGEIISGKIKGRAVYQPTGEPVAGAVILSLDFEDEARGGYPVHKLKPDGCQRVAEDRI